MAKELIALGIPTQLILNEAVGFFMAKVDMVMVGAEGVVESGGIVNKVNKKSFNSSHVFLSLKTAKLFSNNFLSCHKIRVRKSANFLPEGGCHFRNKVQKMTSLFFDKRKSQIEKKVIFAYVHLY